jgi:hypothetical protein
MEQSLPWEADNCSTKQEMYNLLWNLKVDYHVYVSFPLDHILSQMNPIHISRLCVFKIHFIIISRVR